ncbi:hypothetical protein V2647_06875 [Tenacibaculum maritimum]|uniref:hypothetical protein n=1 Tax=Tenacibaculum maritimum TaxID=107401 RepID=UPI00387641E1
MAGFLEDNWQPITQTIGGAIIFILGRKTRKVNSREAEFLAYQKKLETYQREFDLKSGMLENLKKDYEARYVMLESNLEKVIAQNSKLESIILKQEKEIEEYEKKFGSLENI